MIYAFFMCPPVETSSYVKVVALLRIWSCITEHNVEAAVFSFPLSGASDIELASVPMATNVGDQVIRLSAHWQPKPCGCHQPGLANENRAQLLQSRRAVRSRGSSSSSTSALQHNMRLPNTYIAIAFMSYGHSELAQCQVGSLGDAHSLPCDAPPRPSGLSLLLSKTAAKTLS